MTDLNQRIAKVEKERVFPTQEDESATQGTLRRMLADAELKGLQLGKQAVEEKEIEIAELKNKIEILTDGIPKVIETERKKLIERLKQRIMKNGNLSNRIVKNEYGEFEHKHDYVLNNIVCEIIDDELAELGGKSK